ncbi:MAG: site-specific integrase [Bacteroidaceae bacterium]|nr:site-specific integrase [Bacteroidaceae bacterium]
MLRFAQERLEEDEFIPIDEIVVAWKQFVCQQHFFNYMDVVITRLMAAKRIGTARKYQSALQSFLRFIGSRDLMLFEITAELMEDYQQWLFRHAVCMNTVSFYMRILRAVFSRAVKQRLVSQTYPFAEVYTGVAATRKRAIDLDGIQRIKDADLGGDSRLEFARDLFLFSFYCRGMAFVDMAHLTRDSISNGSLCYHRQKTRQQIVVKWEQPMQEIVDRYANGSRYLLPILQ